MAAVSSCFPARCFIQVFETGKLPPDYQLVADEMKVRGVPVVTKSTDEIIAKPLPLTRADLVVGNFDWTRIALRQLGIPMPSAPDYPECLKHLLRRKIWQSTLGEVQKLLKSPKNEIGQIFIKPALDAKAFAAIIEPKDQMLDTLIAGIPGVLKGLPADTPVHCAEVVDMESEYRVYIVDGAIREVCQYRGGAESKASLDMDLVRDAVKTLCTSPEGRDLSGAGMDFAVLNTPQGKVTCLVEVNDGYSLGRYAGISGKDYTDLLVARWARLMASDVEREQSKPADEQKKEKK